jgi:hypothetical protein
VFDEDGCSRLISVDEDTGPPFGDVDAGSVSCSGFRFSEDEGADFRCDEDESPLMIPAGEMTLSFGLNATV